MTTPHHQLEALIDDQPVNQKQDKHVEDNRSEEEENDVTSD